MGFWQKLTGKHEGSIQDSVQGSQNSDTIIKMMELLDGMATEEAQKLACLSYLMARVAHSDLEIDEKERHEMEKIVQGFADLSSEKAHKLTELARNKNELMGTEGFVVSRHLRQIANKKDLTRTLHCLFAIAGVDDSISAEEEAELRQISSELGFSTEEFVMVRSEYRSKRDVLKN